VTKFRKNRCCLGHINFEE